MTSPAPPLRRWLTLAIVTLTLVVADQYTKFLTVRHLTPAIEDALRKGELQPGLTSELGYFYGQVRKPCRARACSEVDVVDGFWSFHYRENPGAAFSFLHGADEDFRIPFFVTTTLIALAGILWYLRKLEAGQRLLGAALMLVFAGAIGNLIDRLYLGYVIDMIHWYVGSYSWPTFNVADSAISVGAVLLVLESILHREPAPAPASDPS
jgi:signal peptidase II